MRSAKRGGAPWMLEMGESVEELRVGVFKGV